MYPEIEAELNALSEAYSLLIKVRSSLSSGPIQPFRCVDHAASHIQKQMDDLAAPLFEGVL